MLSGLAVIAAPRVVQLATTQKVGFRSGPGRITGATDSGVIGTTAATTQETTSSGSVRAEISGKSMEKANEESPTVENKGRTETAATRPRQKKSQKSQKPQDNKGEQGAREQSQSSKKQANTEPPAPADKTMSLSIPRLALVQGDTVLNSGSPDSMDQTAIKLPSTGFPWQEGANTYIAAHRVGWKGTESRYQFWGLPAMQENDAIYLTDANGTTYEYRVTRKFAVKPSDNWVTDPVPGKNLLTLQTCTDSLDPSTWWEITPRLMESGPNSGRLIVRAEKVATYPS